MVEKLHKFTFWLLLATLLLPLGYTNWTAYPANYGKVLIFQIIVDLLLVGWIVWESRQAKAWRLHSIDWLVIGFTLVSLISALFGLDFWQSFWGDQSRAIGVFFELHLLVFYCLLRWIFRDKNHWQKALAVVALAAGLSSFIALLGPTAPLVGKYIPSGRVSGLIGNPIFFANYLLLPIFLSLFGFFYFINSKKYQWLWLAAAALSLIAFLSSRTRGPLLGLLLGAAVAGGAYLLFSKNKKLKIGLGILALALVGILATGFVIPEIRQYYPQSLQYIFSISRSEATAQTRLMAWPMAIAGWQDSPILGQGTGAFRQVFDQYYNPDFLKYSFQETVWDEPHNHALEILVTRGAIGFVVYLVLLAWLAIILIGKIRASATDKERAAYSLLFGGLIGYVGVLFFSFETSNSWQLWFVILAFIAWQKGGERTYALKPILNKILISILVLMSGAGIYYNIQLLRVSYYTSLARDAADLGSLYQWQKFAKKSLDIKSPIDYDVAIFLAKDLLAFDALGDFNRTKEPLLVVGPELDKILLSRLAINPNFYWHKLWLAQIYTMLGEYADNSYYVKSEKLFLEAWEINKSRQQVQLLLAKLYLLQGRIQEGIKILEGLVEQNPAYPEPHWYLGVALQKQGDKERSADELSLGEAHGLGFPQNIEYLINAYAEVKRYNKIIPIYEQLIVANPQSAQYRARLAATYAVLGKKQEALNAISEAVALDPSLRAEAEQFIKINNLNN